MALYLNFKTILQTVNISKQPNHLYIIYRTILGYHQLLPKQRRKDSIKMHGTVLKALFAVLFLLPKVSTKTVTMFYDQEITSDSCYNRYGRPHRCLPEFKNIAYQKKIKVTHTCGEKGPRQFCKSGYEGCGICDASDPDLAHPPAYLTDLNNPSDLTCWQTDPLDVSRENVTLILSLEKQFDVTYINLEFCSYRPDAMVIYKSNDFGRTWTPYQYYADRCMHMFRKSTRGIVSHRNEVCSLVYPDFNHCLFVNLSHFNLCSCNSIKHI